MSALNLYKELPEWVKASPAIVLLLLIIVGLLTGHLYTGRTFEREMGRCTQEATLYKRIAFNAVGFLNTEAREQGKIKHKPTPNVLKDAESDSLEETLEADEKALKP